MAGLNTSQNDGGDWESKDPSLENPTQDYLFNNFNKTELQKHCRHLGLPKIWVTKEKLVDMIMNNYYSLRPKNNSKETQDNDPIQKLQQEVDELKELMIKKNTDIEDLNMILKTAHVTINKLSDRISTLEEQISREEVSESMARTPSEKILLIGDENLSDAETADFASDCSIQMQRWTLQDFGLWRR